MSKLSATCFHTSAIDLILRILNNIEKLNIFFDLCKMYEEYLNEFQFQKYMDIIFNITVTNNIIKQEPFNNNIVKLLIHYFDYCKRYFHRHTKHISKAMEQNASEPNSQNTTESEVINDRILDDLCQSALTICPAFESEINSFFDTRNLESYWAKILLDEFDSNKLFLTPMFYKLQC